MALISLIKYLEIWSYPKDIQSFPDTSTLFCPIPGCRAYLLDNVPWEWQKWFKKTKNHSVSFSSWSLSQCVLMIITSLPFRNIKYSAHFLSQHLCLKLYHWLINYTARAFLRYFFCSYLLQKVGQSKKAGAHLFKKYWSKLGIIGMA